MIELTEQQLPVWQSKLASHNAAIVRTNTINAEHNALLPEGVEPLPMLPLLTLEEYVAFEVERVTRDGEVQLEAEVKSNVALIAERMAVQAQLDAVEAELSTTIAEKETLTTDLATRTSERDALQSQVTALTSEKEALTAQVETLSTSNSTLVNQLIVANTRISDLEQYRPYNPRILKGEAFYDRVSKEDMVTLLTSDNPQLVLVGKTIDAYRDNKWPVILDSTDFQNLVGYVQMSGVFDQAEVDAVMIDATREEAYTA